MTQPPSTPNISPNELFDSPRATGGRMDLRAQLPSLVVNAAAPFAAYQILTANGFDAARALTLSAVFPVLGVGWSFVRTRSADIIGVVSLVFIVAGVAASVISGDPRFILIKESLLTGLFGVVCLVSLLLPKPVMFYFGRQFAGAGDPARSAAFESMWQYPRFRTVNRNMTLAWGIGYVIEALLRVGLSFVLPIPTFLIISPILALAVTIALISWTMAYARRSARQGAQAMAAAAGAPPTRG